MAKKEKISIIEEVQFSDLDHAKRSVTFAKINQIRILIGFVFAAIAMVFTIIGIANKEEFFTGSYLVAFALAIPAYLVGGGIGKALKTAWKITKFCWFLIPVFPVDILIALMGFFFSIFGLMFVPVIFVGLNYVQHKNTLDAAQSYLTQCGYATPNSEE